MEVPIHWEEHIPEADFYVSRAALPYLSSSPWCPHSGLLRGSYGCWQRCRLLMGCGWQSRASFSLFLCHIFALSLSLCLPPSQSLSLSLSVSLSLALSLSLSLSLPPSLAISRSLSVSLSPPLTSVSGVPIFVISSQRRC